MRNMDCGHRYSNGLCELTNKYCEQDNSGRSCYESEWMVKRIHGVTAKEKRAPDTRNILTKLKERYKVYQRSYCDNTSDGILIKEAIEELERLYAEQN